MYSASLGNSRGQSFSSEKNSERHPDFFAIIFPNVTPGEEIEDHCLVATTEVFFVKEDLVWFLKIR